MKLSVAIFLLLVTTNPVLAQPVGPPPCPPLIPGLETIVDTQLKCDCFYSLAGSGLDLGDEKTFDKVFTADSIQSFAQVGDFVGIDGIAEYLSFVQGENGFVTDFSLIGEPLILDFTGSTWEKCVATTAERRQLTYNTDYTINNQEICANALFGSVLYYTLTGNPAAPITIQRINAWAPDLVISGTDFPLITTTPASVELVCDTIVNTCDDETSVSSGQQPTRALKRKKQSKKNKSSKVSKSSKPTEIKRCMRKLKKLPFLSSGDLSYIDGNSISCRLLHSIFARTNPSIHCAHISFEAEEDPNGKTKCDKSKQTKLTDLFTPQQLGLFVFAASLLGLPDSGATVSLERCPAGPIVL